MDEHTGALQTGVTLPLQAGSSFHTLHTHPAIAVTHHRPQLGKWEAADGAPCSVTAYEIVAQGTVRVSVEDGALCKRPQELEG